MEGRIHSFESFGTVDGPGIRFVVFLQGCPLRCRYCHNPDTWDFSGGETYTAEDVLSRALRYRNYWGDKGGITLTGGEPLSQLDFVTELLTLCKRQGIHTAVDTSGFPFVREREQAFAALADVTDLFLLDIKHIRSEAHRTITGQGNERTLDFARFLSDRGNKMWIRYVLVPTLSDQEEDAVLLKEFLHTLKGVEKVQVLPYHTMGVVKYKKLGIPYSLEGISPPDPALVTKIKEILT